MRIEKQPDGKCNVMYGDVLIETCTTREAARQICTADCDGDLATGFEVESLPQVMHDEPKLFGGDDV